MQRLFLLLVACLAFLPAARGGEIVVIPLKGEINKAQFFFLRRGLKEAEAAKADAVILDMDTYGGALDAAMDMQDALLGTSVPTITYIDTNAGSAGALVALSTRRIYMAPVSAIGAAAPVMEGGEDLPSTMKDKTVSYFSGYARSAAQKNGYDPDIAEAFINKDVEVKIGDTVIHPKGTLLTLSAEEAARVINGKPVLASGIATSLQDLVKKAGLNGSLVRISPTGFETLASWLTALAPLLLLGGILGVYIELKVGGFGIAGFMAAICFLLFFFGSYVAGLAGWETAVLFAVGLALIISEIMIHPGTIIPGLAGLVLVCTAVVWAMTDRYPHEPLIPTGGMLEWPLVQLCITIVLACVAIPLVARLLPATPLFRAIALSRMQIRGPSLSERTVDSPVRLAVGESGVALSILRPSGNARFGDAIVDVITRGEFIEPASPIRVLAIEGSRIVVARAA
ncbi:MAG TPA: NfeD family protein [Chthoniobacteraceae bacterium]|jgi:membrane-bound serine protease (ClpP class)|nr:NfeD family protein [Chthoniobacteraceae bacterium]